LREGELFVSDAIHKEAVNVWGRTAVEAVPKLDFEAWKADRTIRYRDE
jgi:hypothetical protein